MAKPVWVDGWSIETFFGGLFLRGVDRYRRTAVFDKIRYGTGYPRPGRHGGTSIGDYVWVYVGDSGRAYRVEPHRMRLDWDLRPPG